MKKLFTLLTLVLCVCTGAWADVTYYTPNADEVIILKDVYDSSASDANYSNHSGVVFYSATASFSSKTVGDPNDNTKTLSGNSLAAKNNGDNKRVTLNFTSVSKITVYHNNDSKGCIRILDLNNSSTVLNTGSKGVSYSEFELDGTKNYSIRLEGYGDKSSNDATQAQRDVYVYAVKLTKYVNKQIATEAFSGVKVSGTALTENATENGYSINNTIVTLTDVSYVKPTTVTLTNHVTYTDETAEDKNVSVTFSDTQVDGYWTGTATIGNNNYTVKVPYSEQTVTSISINGSNISAEDLATLKSTKAVTIDGSSLNGIGTINVTLSEGTASVSRTNSGDNAVFTFTTNGTEVHTVTISNVKKTYTAEGAVFSATSTLNANTHTCNGITFTQTNTGKNFQCGTARVTIGEEELIPVKLSTGSAVNVTFPENKVATKVIVYGWSVNGDGKLYSMGETSELIKSVNVNNDIFYATNTTNDPYPSVYEYNLDYWESLYFNPGGSPSQPFVVMDFVLIDKPTNISAKISSAGWATLYTPLPLDFANATPAGLKAYTATLTDNIVTLTDVQTVPAGTGVVLKGAANTYSIPVIANSETPQGDMTGSATSGTHLDANTAYILGINDEGKAQFFINSEGTIDAGKAYLPVGTNHAKALSVVFANDMTGITNANAAEEAAQPAKRIVNGQLVIEKNGKRYNAAGAEF